MITSLFNMAVVKHGSGPINLAIIGAGPGGLAVAKHALASPFQFKTTIFEQNDQVGGTWIYTPTPSNSSMYKNLRTNLPKQVMSYLDYSFPTNSPSFLSHHEVLKYLNDYACHNNILPNIKFSSKVINVSSSQSSNWEIEVEEAGMKNIFLFDAVAICTGHHTEPRIPNITDLDKFEGKIEHSHSYREPNVYSGLRVLCLGAGPSGIDISVDIAKFASVVYLSHNKDNQRTEYDVKGVVKAKPSGFCLKDGTFLEVDVLLLCTGYVYSFPFLSSNCNITVTDDYISPLYKHLINAHKPSMAFFGIPLLVTPLPLVDLQARFFLQSLLGSICIPSSDIIMEENERKQDILKSKGISLRFTHLFDAYQWDYHIELANEIGCKPPDPVIKKIYQVVKQRRTADFSTYRNFNYKIIDSESFEESLIE